MNDVQPESVAWLWHHRIPVGKLTVLAGIQGMGKSFVTLDVAAKISTGTSFTDTPNNSNPAGSVLVLSCEDGLSDTIAPRLHAMGADTSRIAIVNGIKQKGKFGLDPIHIAEDIHRLHELVASLGDVRLVVVDPITAYVGGDTDIYRDNSVRSVLAPLADFAARQEIAVIAVAHLRKSASDDALFRVLGSVAFTALARSVWMVGSPPESENDRERVLVCSKMNVALPAPALQFSIVEPGKIEWAGTCDLTADEIFAPSKARDSDESGPAVADAIQWLREALADGSMEAKAVKEQAVENSISATTLKRAKRKLHVQSTKEGFSGKWNWTLPKEAEEEA